MNEKRGYVTGILGGLVGGFIASVPWILMYVYGNMILSLLAIIIAIGVLKGYQICKGKVDNKLPAIIVVISLLCVTISTLLIIPLLLLGKEGLEVSFQNLETLYSYDQFMVAIMKDFAVSVIFTILGISGVVANVKKQISEGAEGNITATIKEEKKEQKKEEVKEEIEENEETSEEHEEVDTKTESEEQDEISEKEEHEEEKEEEEDSKEDSSKKNNKSKKKKKED